MRRDVHTADLGVQVCANPPGLAGKPQATHFSNYFGALHFACRLPRTGHTFHFDETVLDPQSEAHVATFLLKSPPQTDSFGTRGWHGRGAWL